MSKPQPLPLEQPLSGTSIDDLKAAAKAAHLRYVTDTRPGITRIRGKDGVQYRAADGSPITDEDTLTRIRK
ncbi:MAG: hypothetical protein J0H57_12555, partial [Rhodospirillales bacterium]|nr:hypothetical protein [Rhodospirillales bacterium]